MNKSWFVLLVLVIVVIFLVIVWWNSMLDIVSIDVKLVLFIFGLFFLLIVLGVSVIWFFIGVVVIIGMEE